MKLTLSILMIAGVLAAAPGSAQAAHHESGMKKMENEVVELKMENDETGEDVKIRLDSRDTGFRMADLQPGDSRTVTDAYGQTVTVTRSDDGIELSVNGQTYDLPSPDAAMSGHEHEVEMKHEGDETSHRKTRIIRRGGDDAFVVISPRPLDEATEQQIRDAFAAMGLTGDVQILDGEDGPEMTTLNEKRHEVHVIREKVDAN